MDAVLVAIISAVAALLGATIPLVTAAVQDSRKNKRDHLERVEMERQRILQDQRKQCAALLRAARDFGVKLQNNYEYHGPETTSRAWDIRQRAADITGQADEIGLLIASLSIVADILADEVNRLVGIAADPQSLALGSSIQPQPPDLTVLGRRISAFKSAAQAVLYSVPSPPDNSLMDGELLSDLPV
jgi:hypothetical protein